LYALKIEVFSYEPAHEQNLTWKDLEDILKKNDIASLNRLFKHAAEREKILSLSSPSGLSLFHLACETQNLSVRMLSCCCDFFLLKLLFLHVTDGIHPIEERS
jgi:hypothetical protein